MANNSPDWYQKVLAQALVPMTLRVGCFNLNQASRFDLYGNNEGFLQNLLLEVSACVSQLFKQSVASSIYSKETPIIRFISRHEMDLSNLENVQIEQMTIDMLAESDAAKQPNPGTINQAVKEEYNQRASIEYSAEAIGAKNHSDFVFLQIASHSDLLIIDASDANDFSVNEFVGRNLSRCESTSIVIVRNNQQADFIAASSSKIDHGICGEVLTEKLKQELTEILLFDSLLETKGIDDTKKIPALLRIADYAGEESLMYQKVDPDFDYQGPIASQTSWISWHNIFKRFVTWLAPKPTAKSGKKSEPNRDSVKDNPLDNLNLQKNSENCHKLYAHFLRADHLAIRYANAHRSSFISIYCLGAFALINAAVAIAFSQIGWLALTSALAEFFALVGIFLIYKNDHKKRYHIKWLEYRSLAEMMRMTPLLNSIGITQSARGFERHRNKHESEAGSQNASDISTSPVTAHNAGRTWLIIYTESLMRWIGHDWVKINQQSLQSAKGFLKNSILKSQLSYHQSNAHKMHVVGHNLGHFSYILFVLAFIFVSGKLLTKGLAAMHLGLNYEMLSHIGHGLGVLAAICPMLGSAAFAIRNHAEFDISSQRSLAMIKSLRRDVEALDNMGESTNYQELVEQTIDTSLVMQAETADWLEIYEVKETEPG